MWRYLILDTNNFSLHNTTYFLRTCSACLLWWLAWTYWITVMTLMLTPCTTLTSDDLFTSLNTMLHLIHLTNQCGNITLCTCRRRRRQHRIHRRKGNITHSLNKPTKGNTVNEVLKCFINIHLLIRCHDQRSITDRILRLVRFIFLI